MGNVIRLDHDVNGQCLTSVDSSSYVISGEDGISNLL